MIRYRQASPSDAVAIAAVHVEVWRTTYAGILPNKYLTQLSVSRNAAHYAGTIRIGACVIIAEPEAPDATSPKIVGFTSAGRSRAAGRGLAEGEIETLYVLDDWRDLGIGRTLVRGAATQLHGLGCRSACVWVLRDNPSRWFYQHLGGKLTMEAEIRVGGQAVIQTAYVWNPIDLLLG